MGFAPEFAGPHDPLPATPVRPRGSIRRTSTIDSRRPAGMQGDIEVDGRAHDLRTEADGTAVVLGEQRVSLTLASFGGVILAASADPPEPRLEQLVGVSAGTGFRRALTQLLPDHAAAGSLLHLLLDDMTGASLVAGYAVQRAEPELIESAMRQVSDQILLQADICAGWADDATIMTFVRHDGVVPTPLGPAAPPVETDDDVAWHGSDAMPANSTRRRRRLDLSRDPDRPGSLVIDVHFRDSHFDADAVETCLHEYSMTGALDAERGTITALDTRARVLPWVECPGAVASAERVIGMTVAEVRTRVRRELTGASTCTHLNDTLRGLADLGPMLGLLDASAPTPRKAAS